MGILTAGFQKHGQVRVGVFPDLEETLISRPALHALALQPVIAGRYRNGYELLDGEWRVVSVHIIIDLMGELAHHMLFDLAP